LECLKWSHGNTKYEIFISILDNLELMFLLPHCLDAKEKIQQVVSDAHLGQALFRVFPRTISTVLRTIWDIILQDQQPAETEAAFDLCLRSFIDSHSTTDDRHDLINQLHQATSTCNSFTSISTVANVSSFALTDIFMSHFDKQRNEESSAEASQSFMQCMSESYISGDESKIDEINYINQDAKASLSLRPIGLVLAKKIQNVASDKPLKTLLDPGSDKTFINRRVLPTGVNGKTVDTLAVNTLNGIDKISQKVILEGLTLPEFSATQKIDKKASAYVFNQPDSPYDLIFGLDLLVPLGIDISCLTQTMIWLDEGIPWKPKSYFDDANLADSVSYETHCFFVNSSDDFDEWIESHSTTTVNIKESKYGKVDTDYAAKQQIHLTPEQQVDLAEVLKDYTPLFNGKLGCYPGYKVHLELNADAKPFHTRPYPVSENNKAVFKAELEQRLVQIGVLSRTGPAEWLSPTFIVPKKDGRVRWVNDFRALLFHRRHFLTS
jgi:hypothetical protein